jgi:hypothetical protein
VRKTILSIILLIYAIAAICQSIRLEPQSREAYLVQRWETLYGNNKNLHSAIGYYDSGDLSRYGVQSWENMSEKDVYHLKLLLNNYDFYKSDILEGIKQDSSLTADFKAAHIESLYESRSPVLKYFFNSPYHFWRLDAKNLSMSINPILDIRYSNDSEHSGTLIQNTRGLSLKGVLDEKMYFYVRILENQSSFPDYVNRFIVENRAIPGNGLYKNYRSGVINDFQGYDYLNVIAHIGVPISRSINLEFGHGNHFLGNGFRSLLLSDFTNNYLYLKFNTKVWKLHYQNLFAELNAVSNRWIPGDVLLPKKYMAQHYLSIKPSSNFEIGFFETVIFSREGGFDLQYLNPIILYRAVEHNIGSPDNVMVGLNTRWSPLKGYSLHGQLLLSEFRLKESTGGGGWWANKIGYQIGLRFYDLVGIDMLDGMIEHNTVRPYTYAHSRPLNAVPRFANASYTHHSMPLAHPLGANFRETIIGLNYQWSKKLRTELMAFIYAKGEDGNTGISFGGNPAVNTDFRQSDFDNFTGQGIRADVNMIRVALSYEFFPNYFLDGGVLMRKKNSELESLSTDSNIFNFGIRANIGRTNFDF